jgi:hypothetical protein
MTVFRLYGSCTVDILKLPYQAKKARQPNLVCSRNGHPACDEGVPQKRSSDYEAGEDCSYNSTGGANEASYSGLLSSNWPEGGGWARMGNTRRPRYRLWKSRSWEEDIACGIRCDKTENYSWDSGIDRKRQLASWSWKFSRDIDRLPGIS